MNEGKSFPVMIPLIVMGISAVHLSFEYFTEGVRSHHLLKNPDIPAISNWFEINAILLLDLVLAMKTYNASFPKLWDGLPVPLFTVLPGSLFYGINYTLGMVAVMTFAFGGVLPLLIALIVAAVLFVNRYIIGQIAGVFPIRRTEKLGFYIDYWIFQLETI